MLDIKKKYCFFPLPQPPSQERFWKLQGCLNFQKLLRSTLTASRTNSNRSWILGMASSWNFHTVFLPSGFYRLLLQFRNTVAIFGMAQPRVPAHVPLSKGIYPWKGLNHVRFKSKLAFWTLPCVPSASRSLKRKIRRFSNSFGLNPEIWGKKEARNLNFDDLNRSRWKKKRK